MHSIETIDRLLINELSATATYQQVLDAFRDAGCMSESEFLIPIYKSHKEAASSLQTQIRELGGTPAEQSGAWGGWARILQDGVNMRSRQATLKILQEAETISAEDYEIALGNAELPLSIRYLIEWKLLLIQKSHARNLGRLLG